MEHFKKIGGISGTRNFLFGKGKVGICPGAKVEAERKGKADREKCLKEQNRRWQNLFREKHFDFVICFKNLEI